MPTPERRQIPRTTLDRLAYIHIEPNNGGIVLNVSNDGLCFHCIAAVEKNGPLRFSLLEQNRRIAACGELAWTDEVHKVAGVRFTTLTADARQQVQDWISQPAVPLEEHSSTLGSALLKAFPRFRIRRSLSGNHLVTAAAELGDALPVTAPGIAQIAALYIHIPYCERKCEYCDFVSVAGAGGQHEYVGALVSELRALGAALDGCRLDTIFCGGGTPGLLDLRLMSTVMDEVRAGFRIAPDAEITLEVNPSSSSAARARGWRAAGFNRVSVGVQSTHADILGFLGRVHDADRALAALAEVRAAGFATVSADLIYAVPGLDDARWQESLQRVVDAGPDHVSCYELTVESGTPLHRAVAEGRVRVVEPEAALRFANNVGEIVFERDRHAFH